MESTSTDESKISPQNTATSSQQDATQMSASSASEYLNNTFDITDFRRRKRSYDSCESDSEDGSTKWPKIEYNSSSVNECRLVEKDKLGRFKGAPTGQRWRGKYPFIASYSLRPRQRLKKCWSEGDCDMVSNRGSRKASRCRPLNRVALSKYRRNTANARERDRMREINTAFTALRGVLPSFATSQMPSMTKITTLQLASSYIRALSDMLKEPEEESDEEIQCDKPKQSSLANEEFNNNTTAANRNYTGKTSEVKDWSSKYVPQEESIEADLSINTFLAREAAEVQESTTGCAAVHFCDSDDNLPNEDIFSWNDFTSHQNFNWDSN